MLLGLQPAPRVISRGRGRCCTASMAIQTTPAAGTTVRRYHSTDHQSVLDICATIYGGSDYIPRVIHELAEDDTVLTLVCNRAGSDSEGSASLGGLVCGQKRAEYYLLFGLRVAEAARGQGLGTLLMQEVCNRYHEVGACKHLVGITTPHQPESMRIFQKLEFTTQHHINTWPPFKLLGQYEAGIGFPTADYTDASVPHMLDWMPGVRQHLEDDAEAGALQQQWQRCTSVEQLQQAVASIRHQQHKVVPLDLTLPWDWVPLVYDIQPCDCRLVQQELGNGNVWLLPGPSNGSLSYQGVMMTTKSKEFRRQVAGILATSSSAVYSAIRKMGEQHKHYVTFIDLVDAAAAGAANLALYDITAGHGSFYVYHKPASSAAASSAGS